MAQVEAGARMNVEPDADLDDVAFLCQPAVDGVQCCFAQYGEYFISDDDTTYEVLECTDDSTWCQQTAEIVTHPPSDSMPDVRMVSVRCEHSDADEGLNEAETGVIVVVSLIAVAAVAGAVAVCRAGM